METGENMNLEEIKSKCLDSAGYLVFAAYLTSRKDSGGRALIDYQYRRYHFTLEDSKQALVALREFVDAEIERLIKTQEES